MTFLLKFVLSAQLSSFISIIMSSLIAVEINIITSDYNWSPTIHWELLVAVVCLIIFLLLDNLTRIIHSKVMSNKKKIGISQEDEILKATLKKGIIKATLWANIALLAIAIVAGTHAIRTIASTNRHKPILSAECPAATSSVPAHTTLRDSVSWFQYNIGRPVFTSLLIFANSDHSQEAVVEN